MKYLEKALKYFDSKNFNTEKKINKKNRNNIHDSVFEPNLPPNHKGGDNYLKAVFSWVAPEYHQHPKSVNWWVTATVVLFAIIVLETIWGNWSMLLATVVFAIVFWFTHHHHPPKHTKIVISEFGIKIGHNKIPYSAIEKFWIINEPPLFKRLCIRTNRHFFADLILELEDQDPELICAFLRLRISEDTKMKITWSDLILRIFNL